MALFEAELEIVILLECLSGLVSQALLEESKVGFKVI